MFSHVLSCSLMFSHCFLFAHFFSCSQVIFPARQRILCMLIHTMWLVIVPPMLIFPLLYRLFKSFGDFGVGRRFAHFS